MSHSNSSLNTFTNCMAKYKHLYIDHTLPCKPPSPHLTFGTMAHEVLYKAGMMRDEGEDNIDYNSIIPSDILYPDLQETFKIHSWENYFKPIIKQVEEYERCCIKELLWKPVTIEREVKLQIPRDVLEQNGITEPMVGIIDLLIRNSEAAIILDYKFSTTKKTQADFDINSQLPLYAKLVSLNYGIPLRNIQVGYIDIPKTEFTTPLKLTNGLLSRSKSQNVLQESYEKCVVDLHGDDPVYNCKPGGFYYDAYCNLALNKAAYMSKQYLDQEVYKNVNEDLIKTAKMIEFMIENNIEFLHKYDSYSCASCEYINSCKPWLTVNFET